MVDANAGFDSQVAAKESQRTLFLSTTYFIDSKTALTFHSKGSAMCLIIFSHKPCQIFHLEPSFA